MQPARNPHPILCCPPPLPLQTQIRSSYAVVGFPVGSHVEKSVSRKQLTWCTVRFQDLGGLIKQVDALDGTVSRGLGDGVMEV